MTDELPTHDRLASEIAAAEARKRAVHNQHGTPLQNEAIAKRISDEVTADAQARKRERDAQTK